MMHDPALWLRVHKVKYCKIMSNLRLSCVAVTHNKILNILFHTRGKEDKYLEMTEMQNVIMEFKSFWAEEGKNQGDGGVVLCKAWKSHISEMSSINSSSFTAHAVQQVKNKQTKDLMPGNKWKFKNIKSYPKMDWQTDRWMRWPIWCNSTCKSPLLWGCGFCSFRGLTFSHKSFCLWMALRKIYKKKKRKETNAIFHSQYQLTKRSSPHKTSATFYVSECNCFIVHTLHTTRTRNGHINYNHTNKDTHWHSLTAQKGFNCFNC